jgi:glycosyltransferase involved in cell wall biosynthesis
VNVLFVIHYPVFGGPHNQGLLLARVLARHGVRLTVLLPSEKGNASKRLEEAGVDVVRIELHRLRASPNAVHQVRFLVHLVKEVRAIRKVIRERRIDIVQIGGLVNPHGAIAARLESVPVVWQILDTRPPMVLRRIMMPLVLRLSDIVMTTGRAVAEVHPGADALGDRLRVFFPPVEPVEFDPAAVDRDASRAAFGFAPTDVVIGTVGNLNPQKGHEYLIRAAARARGSRPGIKILVVGASHDTHYAYERELHRLARSLGFEIGNDLVFAGALSDVRPALAAMDVFVLASVPRSEGAPTAIGEAMMMEVPVVATDVGAVREVVDDGETGIVVPPLDPAAIADAVLRIVNEPRAREEFASRARPHALAQFSAEVCTRVHLSAYEYALANGAVGDSVAARE